MKHLDVRHCWLQEELEKGNFKVKRVDRKFNDMLTHSPSAKVPSHDRLPHDDCEQRKLQCSQDDAEGDACSESDCILDEHGRRSKVLINVLAGVWLAHWRLVGAVAPERVVV